MVTLVEVSAWKDHPTCLVTSLFSETMTVVRTAVAGVTTTTVTATATATGTAATAAATTATATETSDALV